MTASVATYFVFIAAAFFIYWAAAGNRVARPGVVLLANYYFCARFGIFYLALLPACSARALFVLPTLTPQAQKSTGWSEYLGGPDSSHYSPLKQVNARNVKQAGSRVEL